MPQSARIPSFYTDLAADLDLPAEEDLLVPADVYGDPDLYPVWLRKRHPNMPDGEIERHVREAEDRLRIRKR